MAAVKEEYPPHFLPQESLDTHNAVYPLVIVNGHNEGLMTPATTAAAVVTARAEVRQQMMRRQPIVIVMYAGGGRIRAAEDRGVVVPGRH